ncbi:MAG: hypothetical protein HQK89_18460 [Nitrospirae bacterium]|nr:hypothetical protein [Nitrospirota bacterium]
MPILVTGITCVTDPSSMATFTFILQIVLSQSTRPETKPSEMCWAIPRGRVKRME